jgi:hypothetical protein
VSLTSELNARLRSAEVVKIHRQAVVAVTKGKCYSWRSKRARSFDKHIGKARAVPDSDAAGKLNLTPYFAHDNRDRHCLRVRP